MTISAFRTTHGAAEISAKNSAVAPCTHQFLDTLTVQTTKINPRSTPTTPSAPSTTNQHPGLVIPRDGQHFEDPDFGAVAEAMQVLEHTGLLMQVLESRDYSYF
ncbi:hypothetical protein, partial [Mycobacterium sp.]|uniref:hypothetical protein n=1 Tax=Mycobacterium sp. TaxID=1785 RepID=UPI002CE06FD4